MCGTSNILYSDEQWTSEFKSGPIFSVQTLTRYSQLNPHPYPHMHYIVPSVFHSIREIAESMTDKSGSCYITSQPAVTTPNLSYSLPYPEPLTDQLSPLGASPSTVKKMSDTYMLKAQQLKASYEAMLHTAYSKLESIPRSTDSMPLEKIQGPLYEACLQTYRSTLMEWANEAVDLVQCWLNASPVAPKAAAINLRKQSKRQFKSVGVFS